MRHFKTILRMTVRLLRLTAKGVENWPVVLLLVCILSPISPHLRVAYDCTYVGTRGVIYASDPSCPLIAIIDTRNGESLSW